jgi:anti-sigma factor RsiW
MRGKGNPMNCPDIVSLSPLYLSGELDAARAKEFQAHLVRCVSCCRELGLQAELDARLRNHIFTADVNTDHFALDQRIRASLVDLDMQRPSPPVSAKPRWLWPAAGVAAALLIATLGYRVLQDRQVAPICADAALDHQHEVIDQRSRVWLSDRAAIEALAERRGMPLAAVRALANQEHRLERGKLCRLDGRVFLHLVFTDGTREFSVFLGPNDHQRIQAPVRENVNGKWLYSADLGAEHLASFQTDRLTAVVVTDQPGDAAVKFGRFAAGVL